MNELPPALAALLQRELDPDERVLWQARPGADRLFVRSLKRALPGAAFFVFALFFMMGPHRENPRQPADFLFPVYLFLLIGTFSLLSPLWAIWKGRRTVYAVTDRRAILIEAAFQRTAQSFAGEKLVNITRRDTSGGRGDIVLDQIVTSGGKGGPRYREVGFFGIDDVRKVSGLLRGIYERVYRPGRG